MNMSSELRLKKLRASGGYIMAKITDEQQTKGNLGGPDLFLAPIGKIESSYITKYYCNICDQEFEGAPKMEFESPNEVVAENLILVSRGQYVCMKCNGTLAEVREFKKPDEAKDVGNAKPLQPTPEQTPSTMTSDVSSISSVQSTTQPDTQVDDVPTPTVQSTPETTPDTISDNIQNTIQDISQQSSNSTTISSIEGRIVYDHNANTIGIAKQIGIDASQSMVLVIASNDGAEFNVSWSSVKKVGDVIFLDEPSTGHTVESNKCSSCGLVNKKGAKFCEECGTNIHI